MMLWKNSKCNADALLALMFDLRSYHFTLKSLFLLLEDRLWVLEVILLWRMWLNNLPCMNFLHQRSANRWSNCFQGAECQWPAGGASRIIIEIKLTGWAVDGVQTGLYIWYSSSRGLLQPQQNLYFNRSNEFPHKFWLSPSSFLWLGWNKPEIKII